MAKAATQQPPTGPRLNREAALLRDLSKAYLSDREFLRKRPDAKILVFLNSHEIKAYIDPDAPGSLTGFIMQLENAFGGPGRRTVVGLRHDQILNGMLFDPSRVCGILPSHGEEMDREVAFRSHHWLDTVLNLVRQAQQEIRTHRRQAERFAVVARNEKPEGQSEMQGDLVRFFQTHAPALTAILRDSLFSPHKRLQAILDESRLTLFDDIRWTDFGVGAHLAQRLKNLQPSLEQTLEVRNKLGAFDYRQNTVEANLINSAALAHMELLRSELDRGGADHLRVVLVSRARTLLRAAADMAANSRSELLVRHPRMLALTTPDADKVDEAAKLTLGTALDVWQSQLRDHQKSAQEEDATDDLDVLKQPAKAFLDAWDTFEGSRLAIEVKWRGGIKTAPQPTDDGELAKRLIAMFCSDVDVETVLNQSLIERFNEFSSASSRFLLEAAQLGLRARLTKVPASGRVYIAPVAIGAVGPIQVADWPGSPDSDRALSLEEIARRVREVGAPARVVARARLRRPLEAGRHLRPQRLAARRARAQPRHQGRSLAAARGNPPPRRRRPPAGRSRRRSWRPRGALRARHERARQGRQGQRRAAPARGSRAPARSGPREGRRGRSARQAAPLFRRARQGRRRSRRRRAESPLHRVAADALSL